MASSGRRAHALIAPSRSCGWLASFLTGSLLAACGGDDSPATQPERFPVIELHVPPLGCFAPVASLGDCKGSSACRRELGERCVRDLKRSTADRAPIALTCGQALGAAMAFEHCESGAECASGLCGLSGVCLDPCASHDDCAAGQQCRTVEVRLDEQAGLSPLMACARSLVLPSDVQLTVSPLARMLKSGRHELDVPAVDQPAIVFAQGDCAAPLQLLSLHSDERELFRRGVQGAINPVLHDGSAFAALMFPNNPALLPALDGLTLEVRTTKEERIEVVVASRAPGRGVLDLNIFYVGGGTALHEGGFRPGDEHVLDMLASLDRRYREIGLSLGTIHEYEVVGALREELSVLDVPRREVDGRQIEGRPERLDELFSLSAGITEPGINVFLISDMGSYIGIAGGIPGVLGVHGTARSGVALAADLLGDLDGADLVLMHEIGHFLGLFHTTESSGAVLDPLSDTPVCPGSRDEDKDHELASWECEEDGADNLMFWTGAGTALSPQQIQVMASAVVLR